MDISSAVVDFGTEAVLRYREISGRHDNELPEQFLGGFIAPRLHDRFHQPVHIELRYTTLAEQMGAQPTPDVINQIGDYRADIAICDPLSPPVIVELKVFDEGTKISAILYDRDKAEKLLQFGKAELYLGILICETKNHELQSRVRDLETALGRKVLTGSWQEARDGKWKWCVGCIDLQD